MEVYIIEKNSMLNRECNTEILDVYDSREGAVDRVFLYIVQDLENENLACNVIMQPPTHQQIMNEEYSVYSYYCSDDYRDGSHDFINYIIREKEVKNIRRDKMRKE